MKNSLPTILLVDDDSDDAFFVQHALGKTCDRHHFRRVQDGTQAIQYLQRRPPYDHLENYPAPSLLLLDLKTPRQDGFDVLQWLLTHSDGTLPVIVLTGSILDGDRQKAIGLGANEYHEKPGPLAEILELFRGISDRWWSRMKLAAA